MRKILAIVLTICLACIALDRIETPADEDDSASGLMASSDEDDERPVLLGHTPHPLLQASDHKQVVPGEMPASADVTSNVLRIRVDGVQAGLWAEIVLLEQDTGLPIAPPRKHLIGPEPWSGRFPSGYHRATILVQAIGKTKIGWIQDARSSRGLQVVTLRPGRMIFGRVVLPPEETWQHWGGRVAAFGGGFVNSSLIDTSGNFSIAVPDEPVELYAHAEVFSGIGRIDIDSALVGICEEPRNGRAQIRLVEPILVRVVVLSRQPVQRRSVSILAKSGAISLGSVSDSSVVRVWPGEWTFSARAHGEQGQQYFGKRAVYIDTHTKVTIDLDRE